MINMKNYGVRAIQPVLEPNDYTTEEIMLPDDHPCFNCIILELKSGVPYCFLPHCDKDIFLKPEDSR